MRILIHIGVPKTGSTAIQTHLAMNRGWLAERNIAVPDTGHSQGYGHVLLFEDQTNDHLQRLRLELEELAHNGVQLVILSWEGLNTFNVDQLENVRSYLGAYAVEVLAYLREQSEVVQSGYLQAIKQRPQKRSLDDFNLSDRLITPAHIDYATLLQRYAAVFGASAVRARIYERQLLVGGNVVNDFFSLIDAEPDERFILATNEQNISLDVGSASVLNVMDGFYSNKEERESLVDLLLCQIDNAGIDEKYFLAKRNVEKIREHYADTNALVLRDFVDVDPGRSTLFAPDKPSWTSTTNLTELGAQKFIFLSELSDYRSWRGDALEPALLQTVASPVLGWSAPEPNGLWSHGGCSHLRFRICPTTIPIHATALLLSLQGHYFSDNVSTRVQLPGLPEQSLSLAEAVLTIPLAAFDAHGCIDIVLCHDKPTSPKSLGMSEDDRELAYFLKKVEYRLDA